MLDSDVFEDRCPRGKVIPLGSYLFKDVLEICAISQVQVSTMNTKEYVIK